jgi:Fe-S-cluster containining protein
MNSVYSNDSYIKEMNEAMEEMKILRFMNPQHSYQIIRNEVTKIVNTEKFQKAITCGSISNCSFCCHDKIMMGKAESEYIKKVIIDKKIIPNKHRITVQNGNTTPKWIDKACPMLLDENEKGQRLCSIYEDRPLICRTHNSSMDPQLCNKENDPKRIIREAKIAILDAFSFTSFALGLGAELDKYASKTMVSMHEMLGKMEF